MLLRTILAFPLYVLISGALFAAGFALSLYDYNMLNRPLQFASAAIILAGPLVCGAAQYTLGRKRSSSMLSLWGGVAVAVFFAPLLAFACGLLFLEYGP
jgi:hypothetical protein